MSDTLLVIRGDHADAATFAHTLQLAKDTGYDLVAVADGDAAQLAQALGLKVLAGTTYHVTVVAEGWSRPYAYVLELSPNGKVIPAETIPAVRQALTQGFDTVGKGAVRGYDRWALKA